MVPYSKRLGWLVVRAAAALVILVLAGCQPAAPEPAQTPNVQSELAVTMPAEAVPGSDKSALAEPAATTPADDQSVLETGYPEPEQPPLDALPTESYPAPEGDGAGPGGAPARPNASRVTAELIEAAPDEANPALVRLRVKLLASQPIEGMASLTDELVNQEIEILIEAAMLPDLQEGDIFEAEVAYLGDEHGANYQILNMLNQVD